MIKLNKYKYKYIYLDFYLFKVNIMALAILTGGLSLNLSNKVPKSLHFQTF